MTGVIIQARTGSTRFPNKVLKEIGDGKTSIEIICDTCQKIEEIDIIVITCPEKDLQTFRILIKSFTNKNKIDIFAGSESNVYQRVLDCAEHFNIDIIVDITSDCPFVSGYEIKRLLNKKGRSGRSYSNNVFPSRRVPDGMDIQIYDTALYSAVTTLQKSHSGWNVATSLERFVGIGFVDYFLCSSPFKGSVKYARLRITLDTREDLEVLRKIYQSGKWKGLNSKRGYKKFCKWLSKQPSAFWTNKDIVAKTPEEE